MSAKGMFYSETNSFSNADERLFARESLVFNTTEDLLIMLEDLEITKSDLAKRLGKSKSYVTQILSGSRNMTLGSFSDICFALGFKPEIKMSDVTCPYFGTEQEINHDDGFGYEEGLNNE